MPVSNTSLKERPPQRGTTVHSSRATERDGADVGAAARPPRPSTPGVSAARNRATPSPLRVVVGMGLYTIAVAASAVMATELMTNGRPDPASASAPQRLQPAPASAQLLGPRPPAAPSVAAPAAPVPAPPAPAVAAPVPAPRPTGKAGRAAARHSRVAGNGAGTVVNAPLPSDQVWDRLAACESSGRWSVDTGNGYYGGLQFKQSTWRSFGGLAYATHANNAGKAEQIAVARRVLAAQGWQAWPTCSRKTGLRSVPVNQVLAGHPMPAGAPVAAAAAHPVKAPAHSAHRPKASAHSAHRPKAPAHSGHRVTAPPPSAPGATTPPPSAGPAIVPPPPSTSPAPPVSAPQAGSVAPSAVDSSSVAASPGAGSGLSGLPSGVAGRASRVPVLSPMAGPRYYY